jgi:hypothetical protein
MARLCLQNNVNKDNANDEIKHFSINGIIIVLSLFDILVNRKNANIKSKNDLIIVIIIYET